jgi:hypothetical protein
VVGLRELKRYIYRERGGGIEMGGSVVDEVGSRLDLSE